MDKVIQNEQPAKGDAQTGTASDQAVVKESAPSMTNGAQDKPASDKPSWAHLYEMEPHRLAEIFPMPPDVEILVMAESIKKSGQQNPIVRHEWGVLDGRCRQRACKIAGVEPWVVDFKDLKSAQSPLEYVVAQNLHRRHLSDGQRATIAADLATRLAKEFPQQKPVPANQRGSHTKASITNAAAMLNAKPRLVESAVKVREKGTPALVKMMKSDEIAISAAEKVASLPAQQQEELVAAGKEAIRKKARELRAAPKGKGKPKLKKKGASATPTVTDLSIRVNDKPEPNVARLIQQNWYSMPGGAKPAAGGHAILVIVPTELPADDDMKRFLNSAHKLGCGTLMTKGLKHFIGDARGPKHPPPPDSAKSEEPENKAAAARRLKKLTTANDHKFDDFK